MIIYMARSRAGIALQQRMTELGVTQSALGRAIGRSQTWVSQSLLDDTEATMRRLWISEPDTFHSLMVALKWGADDFEQSTGLTIPMGMHGLGGDDSSTPETRADKERGSGGAHPVRFVGSVSAGLTGDGIAMPIDWIHVADQFLGDHRARDLFALEVTGDSMVSEDTRLTIPPGSIVIVHEHLQPRPGSVVVAWLDDQDLGVLKVYKRQGDGAVWLLSHNSEHEPIKVSDETPATIRGVMIGHWTPAQGAR